MEVTPVGGVSSTKTGRNKREEIAIRRDRILQLMTVGVSNQHEISRLLDVPVSTINTDIQGLKTQAEMQLGDHIPSTALTYSIILGGVYKILETAWIILHNTNNENVKLQSLYIIGATYDRLSTLMSNQTVIKGWNDKVRHDLDEWRASELEKLAGDKRMLQRLHEDQLRRKDREIESLKQQLAKLDNTCLAETQQVPIQPSISPAPPAVIEPPKRKHQVMGNIDITRPSYFCQRCSKEGEVELYSELCEK